MRRQIEEGADIDVIFAENVRPSLDEERLGNTKAHLARLFQTFRASGTNGFSEVRVWSETGLLPTARVFGRAIHFMGQRADWDVLGVDIGSATCAVATSLGSELALKVHDDLGVGHSARGVLEHIEPKHLARWLTSEDEQEAEHAAVNHVWNKWLFPNTVPQTPEELELELALAREVLRVALMKARESWLGGAAEGQLPHFGEIVASGGVLGYAPRPGDSALVMLDALQPVGATQLWLDAHGVAAALGSAAPLDIRAVIEVIETGGFLNLGTAICPTGRARSGQVILRAHLAPEGEPEQSVNVRAGSIVVLPLRPGLPARLTLRPRGIDIGLPRSARNLDVVGGALGVIIDARGRPLRIPRSASTRREVMREWRAALLGGTAE
jgi:hypothetical protein